MKQFSEGAVRHRKLIMILALLLCAASLFAMLQVEVSYDMSEYLPPDAPTRKALDLLASPMPNLQLYLPGVSPEDSLHEKEALEGIRGVLDVIWLDDSIDLRGIPFEVIDPETAAPFYSDGPLFQLTLDEKTLSGTVKLIREHYPDALLKGTAADSAEQINGTMPQVASIMLYVLPLCLLILILATRHWVEPILFLITIGAAILLNEGSNIIFGRISYITRACAALLQLAVSIDYAVFLLHRFNELRDEGMPPAEAMKLAMRKASSAIAASALTTVFGFLALILMDFSLGKDMGLVLAKGVLLSYLSVMVLLPAVAVAGVKWIDRTLHRSFMPSFKRSSRLVLRFAAPLAVVVILVLPLAFIAQRQNVFLYGSGGMHSPDSPVRLEQNRIEARFGSGRMMLLMVPSGDRAREAALGKALKEVPEVRSVMSYADTVSPYIPPEVLDETASGAFYQPGYARFILNVNTPDEGKEAFRIADRLKETAEALYPGKTHLLGESTVNQDLMKTITGDSLKVLLAGLLSIGLVLLVTFRSFSIPLILLLVIQGSIWLNMGLPYFQGSHLNYIGYLIVSSVQLGATVDYGILLSQRYLEGRRNMPPREAASWALSVSAGSILPPAMILTLAGSILGMMVNKNGIISEMGIIIGRGAAISCGMVLLVLPQILVWCDGLIRRTTMKSGKE